MKKRHIILLVLLFICYLLSNLGTEQEMATTFSPKPTGVKAIFTLFEEEGIDVSRWFEPYSALPAVELKAVLFVITPETLAGEEELLSWVAQGNRLVFFDRAGFETFELKKGLEIREGDTKRIDLQEKLFEGRAERFSCGANLKEQRCQGVSRITRPSRSFIGLNQFVKPPPEAEILSGSRANAYAFVLEHGAGEAWYFNGNEPVINRYIDAADNAQLFLQIVSGASKVYFDEFHHGFSAPLPETVRKQTSNIYLFIGALFIWLLVGAVSRSIRFGNPILEREQQPSANIDFVRALGLLYYDRQAHSVLTKYLASWKKRAKGILNLRGEFSSGQLLTEMVYQGLMPSADQARAMKLLSVLESPANESPSTLNEAIIGVEQLLNFSKSKRK